MKLGIEVSWRTISRLMPRCRKPPSQTWRAFLDNHVHDLVSIDFFTVPTATFRVLFVLVALAHHRRRVIHFHVTEHPTALWAAQQMVEAFPVETFSRRTALPTEGAAAILAPRRRLASSRKFSTFFLPLLELRSFSCIDATAGL